MIIDTRAALVEHSRPQSSVTPPTTDTTTLTATTYYSKSLISTPKHRRGSGGTGSGGANGNTELYGREPGNVLRNPIQIQYEEFLSKTRA